MLLPLNFRVCSDGVCTGSAATPAVTESSEHKMWGRIYCGEPIPTGSLVNIPARIRTRPVSVPGTYRYTARTRARPGLPASRFGRASRHPATAGLLPGKPEGRQRERALKIRREGAENPPALTGFPPGRIRNLNLKSTGNGKESTGPGRPGGRTRVARRPADELGSLSQSRRGRQLRNTNISDRCGWGRTDRHLACSRNQ